MPNYLYSSFVSLWLLLLIISNDNCQAKPDSQTTPFMNQRIINGVLAKKGKWKFMAAVLNQGNIMCGGTVVNDDSILTAAHCLSMDPNDITVYVGNENIANLDNNYLFSAKKLIPHEKYDSQASSNDIGIIKLTKKIDFKKLKKVQRVCIPTQADDEDKSKCVTMGWGKNAAGQPTKDLFQVIVPVLDDQKCAKYSDIFNKKVMLCAGYLEGGKDACQGDSGGPLVCPYKDDSSLYSLRGVVSFGHGCAQPNNPGYYTRVVNYVDWIRKTAES